MAYEWVTDPNPKYFTAKWEKSLSEWWHEDCMWGQNQKQETLRENEKKDMKIPQNESFPLNFQASGKVVLENVSLLIQVFFLSSSHL